MKARSCQQFGGRHCDVHSLGRYELPRCEVMLVDALLSALPSLYLHISMTIMKEGNIQAEWINSGLCCLSWIGVLGSR